MTLFKELTTEYSLIADDGSGYYTFTDCILVHLTLSGRYSLKEFKTFSSFPPLTALNTEQLQSYVTVTCC